MPILEEALSVPVFAPAEAQLALARGAALASRAERRLRVHRRCEDFDEPRALSRRRQLGQTGPLALLVAGVLTFTVSASVAVSLQLAPKKDAATPEPRPAAKTSSETPAAATHVLPPVATPSAPVVEALPPSPPAAPPVEVAPPPVYSETPVSIPEPQEAVTDAPPVEGVPPEAPVAPPPPEAPPLPPEQLAPPVAPAPVEQSGNLSRIRDRLRGAAGTTKCNRLLSRLPPQRHRAAATRRPAAAAACLTPTAPTRDTLVEVRVLRVTLRVAIVLAVVLALVAVATSTRSGLLWRLSTFTYQANVLAAAYYLWTLAWPRADARIGCPGRGRAVCADRGLSSGICS